MAENIDSIFANFEARLWAGLDARFKAQEEFVHERYRKTDATLARIERGLGELTVRVGHLDQNVAGLRRDIALLHEITAAQGVRLDGIGQRVGLIEKRLGLLDEVQP